MNDQPNIWNETSLGPGPVSLFLCASEPGDRDQAPEVMFGAASNGETSVAVLQGQLAAFLREHTETPLICYDAASLHWLMHDYFQRLGDKDSIERLWDCSKDCRLIDVRLLGQHVRRIEKDDVRPDGASLAELAKWYRAGQIPGRAELQRRVGSTPLERCDDFDRTRIELPVAVAAALVRVHAKLEEAVRRIEASIERVDAAQYKYRETAQRQAGSIVAELVKLFPPKNDLPPPKPSGPASVLSRFDDGFPKQRQCGPLGIGLDVLGAIAFRQAANEGMEIDAGQIKTLQSKNEQVYRQASQTLQKDHLLVSRLKWKQGSVVRDSSGAPANARAALQVTLRQKQKELFDRIECDPLIPRKTQERLSDTASQLRVWAKCDPFLAAWVDLIHSADVARFAVKHDKSKASPTEGLHPRADLTCVNLRHIQKLGVPVFVPSPGNVFLVVRLTDLRLRCLAALCRSKFVNAICSLYSQFSSNEDPVCLLARKFHRHSRVDLSWNQDDEEFDDLQKIRPNEYARWIRLARGVLETLPLGLPAVLSLRILENEFVLEGIGKIEWEYLVEIVFNGAVMEMQPFLFYDVAETLAKNLEIPEETVRQRLRVGRLNPENRPRHDSIQSKVHGDLTRRRATPLIRDLARQSDSHHKSEHAPPTNADVDLLKITEKSVGGRVSSRWYPAEVRRQEWFFLIDDAVNLFVYALVRHGFRLVGVVEDEVLLEIPSSRANDDLTTKEIGALCQESTRKLLGAAAPPCQFSWLSSWPASLRTRDGSQGGN